MQDTQAVVDRIDAIVARIVPEIDAAVYYVGATSALAIAGSPNQAFARVRLVPGAERERSVQEIIPRVQEELDRQIADADVTVLNGGFDSLLALATGGQGYQIEIFGTRIEDVIAVADAVQQQLSTDPDVLKAETDTSFDAEQLYLALDQGFLGTLGVSSSAAGLTARILMSGVEVGSYTAGAERIPIRLTSLFEDRAVGPGILSDMTITNAEDQLVSFAAFSRFSPRQTVSAITKRNRAISTGVRGFLYTEDQSGVSIRTEAMLAAMDLPPGVSWRRAGTSELIVDSITSLVGVLAIAIFLVYVVMVIQFERYGQPLIIMAAIPFCLIGVVAGLAVFSSALSIIAMLGLITLGGTVVNNAIVMVDYMNTLRSREGLPLDEAILEGAAGRLRPVLMTTLTTLFAVLPMALAVGDGSEVYAPLGQAIFGGLFTSTAITLFVVPVLYRLLERRSGKGAGGAQHGAPGTTRAALPVLLLALLAVTAPAARAQVPSQTTDLAAETARMSASFSERVDFSPVFEGWNRADPVPERNRDIVLGAVDLRIAGSEARQARSRIFPTLSARSQAAWIANPVDAVTLPAGSLGTIPLSNIPAAGLSDVALPERETQLFPAADPLMYELGLSLVQPIDLWGSIRGSIAAAEAAERAASARLSATRHGIAVQTRARTEQIAILKAVENSLSIQAQAAERLVALTRENWTNGFITETAYLDAQLSRQEALLALAETREQRGTALEDFGLLTVREQVSGALQALPPAAGRLGLDEGQTLSRVLAGNRELVALTEAASARTAAARAAAASRSPRPELGLHADVSWTGAFADLGESAWEERGAWQAQIALALRGAIFDAGRSGATSSGASIRYARGLNTPRSRSRCVSARSRTRRPRSGLGPGASPMSCAPLSKTPRRWHAGMTISPATAENSGRSRR
jgi:outer membrane protein TolC